MRPLRPPGKYENYHENEHRKLNSGKGEKAPTKSIRELPRKNQHRRSCRAEKKRELPRETRFGPFEEQRKPTKSTRITTKNPYASTAATRKVRELPRKMNMQARNHENSDGFRMIPSGTSDLAPRPFTSVNHTVWAKKTSWRKMIMTCNGFLGPRRPHRASESPAMSF